MPSPPICVTGANGFIAGWVVEELLKAGYTVHGTVRDPHAKKNKFLLDIEAKYKSKSSGKLILFPADLSIPDSFDPAVVGCEVVIHVAAVVVQGYKKSPDEIIVPTCDGIRNIVSACEKSGTVKKIVYTSSQATVVAIDKYRKPEHRGKPFTEDVWATHVTPTYGTYNYSKIVSERLLEELWLKKKVADAAGGITTAKYGTTTTTTTSATSSGGGVAVKDRELVSLLPGWVMGPQQNDQITTSQQLPRAIINKEYKLVPPLHNDWVDVRDVARAHFYAATTDALPTGRYSLTVMQTLKACEMAVAVNKADPKVKAPTWTMPWIIMWVASWFDKRLSSFLLYEKTVRLPPVDNTKIQKYGFRFNHTDIVETMRACLESFREFGITKN